MCSAYLISLILASKLSLVPQVNLRPKTETLSLGADAESHQGSKCRSSSCSVSIAKFLGQYTLLYLCSTQVYQSGTLAWLRSRNRQCMRWLMDRGQTSKCWQVWCLGERSLVYGEFAARLLCWGWSLLLLTRSRLDQAVGVSSPASCPLGSALSQVLICLRLRTSLWVVTHLDIKL